MNKERFKKIILNILRIVCLISAVISAILHYYSYIAIIIGILIIILDKKLIWKINGAVVSFFAGLGAYVAVVSQIKPPLDLIFMSVLPGIGIYFLLVAVFYLIKIVSKSKVEKQLTTTYSHKKKIIAALIVIGIITPSILWSTANINLKVLFDNKPKMLWVHAPTTPVIAEEFIITVQAWDSYERLAASYNGTIQFSIQSYDLNTYEHIENGDVTYSLPDDYSFLGQRKGYFTMRSAYMINDGKDNGKKSFSIYISTPGIHFIKVQDISEEDLNASLKIPYINCEFFSNPIVVLPASEEDRANIYWGDIHTHSKLSDGAGKPEHNAYYARNVAMIDYYALTDHSEIMFWQPWRYQKSMDSVNAANTPGEFVAFNGIEWTNVETGHYTLIFNGDKMIHYPNLKPGRWSNVEHLWEELDAFTEETGYKVLAMPHHTTKKLYPQDWSVINPKYVKYAEVSSTHGECLFQHHDYFNYQGMDAPPPQEVSGTSIMDALKMGHNLTLYASSDEHAANPGHSLTHAGVNFALHYPRTGWAVITDKIFPGGLTAVYANELTRESVYDGLYNTRVYANSDHGRPFLDFSVNGVRVGDGSTAYLSLLNEQRIIRVLIAQDGSPAGARLQSASSLINDNWQPNWNATVEIFKNGELFYSYEIDSPINEIIINDNSTVTGTSYNKYIFNNGNYYLNDFSNNPINPASLNTQGRDFYVVRISGENGRYTYAGAIWVTT